MHFTALKSISEKELKEIGTYAENYLKDKNHTEIEIKPAQITIEDVFMDL